MAKTQRPSGAYQNLLLANLLSKKANGFFRHLQPISLEIKKTLYLPGSRLKFAYFIETGMVSVVSHMADKRNIEIGTIGLEGMVGSIFLLSPDPVPYHYYVQIAGHGYRLPAEILKDEAKRNPVLHELILRYQAAFLAQVMQAGACNGLHSIQQRCCRWILMAQDRVESDKVPLTHEFLGIMLAVRRASVSEVLLPIQSRGWIRSHRGVIEVLDRKGLESGSCECYDLIAKQHALLAK